MFHSSTRSRRRVMRSRRCGSGIVRAAPSRSAVPSRLYGLTRKASGNSRSAVQTSTGDGPDGAAASVGSAEENIGSRIGSSDRRRAPFGDGAERVEEHGHPERLLEIAGGAGPHRLRAHGGATEGGDDEHRKAGMPAPQGGEQIDPVAARHLLVEDDGART